LISAREVFSTFFEPGECRGWIAVLYRVWLDDSADGKQEQFILAAGLIGRQKQWNDFSKRWKAVLREPPRIQWFHSKEWRSLTGEFLQFRDKEKWPRPNGGLAANAKREKLKQVIADSKLVGIGIGIEIPDYHLVRNCDQRAAECYCADPYAFVLQSLVYECAKGIQLVATEEGRGEHGHCIGYVSDDSNKSPIYSSVYSDFKLKNPKIAPIMRGLAHLDDKKWPGLQAADLMAHLVNQVFKQQLAFPENERVLLTSIPELQGTFWKIARIDKYYLCSALEDMKGVDLFGKLGIEKRLYKTDEELDYEKKSGKSRIRTI